VAVTPDGSTIYVATGSGTVSVIDRATNTVTVSISISTRSDMLVGLAVTPDGRKVYVANIDSNTVAVIDRATNTVNATIAVGRAPQGVAVRPDGSTVYVANGASNSVSVIATATNTVTATIPVGRGPGAFGVFIQPPPRFAGTPGFSNCHGNSVAALVRQFGGLHNAAAALGFLSVQALEHAILAFCGS
jgi:YVTN family beta-propeller protein